MVRKNVMTPTRASPTRRTGDTTVLLLLPFLSLSLVIFRQLFQPFPLLLVMTENHQPDMLPFDQIKQFHRTGADRFGVGVATVALLVTGKALAKGYSVNRQ